MPDYGDDRGFGMNVPQRAMTRTDHQRAAQDQWDANRRYSQAQMLMNEPGARAKEREVARDFGGNIRSFQPHRQEGINTRTDPARATELGWAGNWPGTPLGYSMDPRWNYTTTPGDPFDYTTSTRGIEDEGLGLGLEEAAIGGGSAAAAAGMGTKTLDTRAEEKLWKLANKNVNPGGNQPIEIIKREWDRLKKMFYGKKYGGGPLGTGTGGPGNVIKNIGKYGKWGGPLATLAFLGTDYLDLFTGESGGIDPEFATQQGSQFSFSRGGIASLIRRL